MDYLWITVDLVLGYGEYKCCDNLGVDDPGAWSVVYSAQAIDDSVKRFFSIPIGVYTTFVVYANFGGIGFPTKDLEVTFRGAYELIAGYNEANTATYQGMIDGSYCRRNTP